MIKRARCRAGFNLALTEAAARQAPAPGHVSLVVVPEYDPWHDSPMLRAVLEQWLDARRLLTTRHHVVGPAYVPVQITARLSLQEDALFKDVRAGAIAAVRAFFDPLTGGTDRQGWPFGRAVYVSEVYEILEKVTGVDYVEAVGLTADPARR